MGLSDFRGQAADGVSWLLFNSVKTWLIHLFTTNKVNIWHSYALVRKLAFFSIFKSNFNSPLSMSDLNYGVSLVCRCFTMRCSVARCRFGCILSLTYEKWFSFWAAPYRMKRDLWQRTVSWRRRHCFLSYTDSSRDANAVTAVTASPISVSEHYRPTDRITLFNHLTAVSRPHTHPCTLADAQKCSGGGLAIWIKYLKHSIFKPLI